VTLQITLLSGDVCAFLWKMSFVWIKLDYFMWFNLWCGEHLQTKQTKKMLDSTHFGQLFKEIFISPCECKYSTIKLWATELLLTNCRSWVLSSRALPYQLLCHPKRSFHTLSLSFWAAPAKKKRGVNATRFCTLQKFRKKWCFQ